MEIINASKELKMHIGGKMHGQFIPANPEMAAMLKIYGEVTEPFWGNAAVDTVKFGDKPESSTIGYAMLAFLVIFGLSFIVGSLAPFVGFVVGVIAFGFVQGLGTVPPDTRKAYKPAAIGILQHDRVFSKGTGGSLGGAAVGGLLFGGAGAVVGAISAGNGIAEYNNLVIKFTCNEWVVIGCSAAECRNLIKSFDVDQECPI